MYRQRNRAPDNSGTYGRQQLRGTSSSFTTRLRRSLRGGAPPPTLTRHHQFEKIISYVAENTYRNRERTILRQFNMPSYILAEAQGVLQTKSKASNLELLPTVVLMEIINKLEGNDQIMASLACKTLASIVEASPIRKIANITHYCWSLKAGWKLERKEDRTTDAQFIMLGYLRPPEMPPRPSYFHPSLPWCPSYDEVDAARDQVTNLQERVAGYLGGAYAWCWTCETFRLLNKKWWTEFAEYENPGIVKDFKVTKKKVNDAIAAWDDKKVNSGNAYRSCPAHALLEERPDGKRVVEEPLLPPKRTKGKRAKAAKKNRATKLPVDQSDMDSDDFGSD